VIYFTKKRVKFAFKIYLSLPCVGGTTAFRGASSGPSWGDWRVVPNNTE